MYSDIYQQGVAEGVSIFVAAGDEQAAACDAEDLARHGIAVNGLASTPFNVAVGGTDFSDTYSGTTGVYWSSDNSPSFGSAKSYIPEIPWNDPCTSILLATFNGYVAQYGPIIGPLVFRQVIIDLHIDGASISVEGAGGGPSGCATGEPSIPGVVSGTCAAYPKPSWQSGVVRIPLDNVRVLPDVSLFAASGFWNHYYLYCWFDMDHGGQSCTGDPGTRVSTGGTSAATPVMAGIQALVNNHAGGRQGNPNYRLYRLAAKEYGKTGNLLCDSSSGNATSKSCVFYDITLGNIYAPCGPSIAIYNCYSLDASTYLFGVLSTSAAIYAPAYGAAVGWDFATGIGSINVANLMATWNTRMHDFNGDGVSDILWRYTTGYLAAWLMNGPSVLSSIGIG
jgi:subtilase family serine protease